MKFCKIPQVCFIFLLESIHRRFCFFLSSAGCMHGENRLNPSRSDGWIQRLILRVASSPESSLPPPLNGPIEHPGFAPATGPIVPAASPGLRGCGVAAAAQAQRGSSLALRLKMISGTVAPG